MAAMPNENQKFDKEIQKGNNKHVETIASWTYYVYLLGKGQQYLG